MIAIGELPSNMNDFDLLSTIDDILFESFLVLASIFKFNVVLFYDSLTVYL